MLRRTWWSLSILEQNLCSITSRPSIIMEPFCSVPLPAPITEERIMRTGHQVMEGSTSFLSINQRRSYDITQSSGTPVAWPTLEANSGSYFKATVELSIIVRSILTSLYSAASKVRSASEIQQDMVHLGSHLDNWELSLPKEFNFRRSTNDTTQLSRERLRFGSQACSARILLTRPCLDALGEDWEQGIEASFAQRMRNICFEAARMIVDFLPETPSSGFIYDQGPWWCVVHHLMQAISVFLLGLSYSSIELRDTTMLLRYTRKVGRWLQAMHDPVAQRAWSVVGVLIEAVASR